MNGWTNFPLSLIKIYEIKIIVKMLFQIERRKDPIELDYKSNW